MQNLHSDLPFRQIHLDFHTSPDIEDIGIAFNSGEWQRTLRLAHVNSINLFAKCHHGLSYHPTTVGRMHPHLKFDLLRAQINACRDIDVRTPIYLSAGLDNTATLTHPEWREITAEGGLAGWSTTPLQPGFHKMCFNTRYVEYLCEQIQEVDNLFSQEDGFWLDIVYQGECCCNVCLKLMNQKGLDPEKSEDRKKCAELALHRYFEQTTAACRRRNPLMPVFHNSGHVMRGRRDWLQYQTHLELESLPTGGWGYDHFPESASYAHSVGYEYLGMTGKFHTTWGEFGGFKHPNALRYECAAMTAFGAKCSIGDQLHPDGQLDLSTYKSIAAAYSEVETNEPWCRHAEPVADIAILSVQAETQHEARHDTADTGAVRLLLEGHHLFSLIDRETDFKPFSLLILPDEIRIDQLLEKRINTFLANGGKMLLTGRSGLRKHGSGFAFDLGVKHSGTSEFAPDYVLPEAPYRPDFVDSPLVMYERSERIKVERGGAESLGKIFDPYFNRSFRHFCSHQHAPNRRQPSSFDCGVGIGNIVYLAHPVFSLYHDYGAVAYRQYVLKVINTLFPTRTIKTNLPSSARVTMTIQRHEGRRVVHLLYANKLLRATNVCPVGGASTTNYSLEVIEELDPIHNIQLVIAHSSRVRRITLEPEGTDLKFTREGSSVGLLLDAFKCHQMIVLHEA